MHEISMRDALLRKRKKKKNKRNETKENKYFDKIKTNSYGFLFTWQHKKREAYDKISFLKNKNIFGKASHFFFFFLTEYE